jgi:hypothetical protein
MLLGGRRHAAKYCGRGAGLEVAAVEAWASIDARVLPVVLDISGRGELEHALADQGPEADL